MSNYRYEAIKEIDLRQPRKIKLPADQNERTLKVSEFFGCNTFNREVMKERLPRDVFEKLIVTIESGKKLDSSIADTTAHVIKDWALEKGVTHFCHWFQPQTGLTAEKHDAFLTFDDAGAPIEKFSGAQLIQGEPDASSFPSGGMRATFEARGYTAWDPSSPIFIMESLNGKTLCIPSVFISYHGHALDEKTPLLRAMDALNKNATELLNTIGQKDAKRVVPTVGPEQEYFLIDRRFLNLRPDLLMSGRTLLGQQPPRGQQLEDHYFGSIPTRALAFMREVETELYKLGIPVKTRHNEVAPSQYESAPVFEEANVASDHNQLVMEVMRRVSSRHKLALLLHEKPFAEVNGNGKHCNWSMALAKSSGKVENLLEPGQTPHQNLRFLIMLAAVCKGIHRHAGLLRASIATPGNDHRLGANEAPPAIVSIFLGKQLTEICDKIEKGVDLESPAEAMISLGVSKLPAVSKDNTDRNRTSPFAFTGNKFEYRAVGSSIPISFPATIVTAAVAEALGELNEKLKSADGKSVDASILKVVKETLKETKAVRFEGNNYSDDWLKEADARGLLNLKRTPEAVEQLLTPSSKKLLSGLNILDEKEIDSRYHIMLERYVKKLLIEAEMLCSMVDTYVMPAAVKELGLVGNSMAAMGGNANSATLKKRLGNVSAHVDQLAAKKEELVKFLAKVDKMDSDKDKAITLSTEGATLMEAVREKSDALESEVSDEFWPLPKYREMLFIS